LKKQNRNLKTSPLKNSVGRNLKFEGYSLLKDPVVFFAGALSLIFRLMSPPEIRLNSPHDDLLGVQEAKAIMDGNWLGSWNNRIFIKPPGYSIFLSYSQFFTNSTIIIIHIFYILASIYFIVGLLHVESLGTRKSKIFARIAFVFLIFNPVLFATEFSRYYRISLNTVFVLTFLAVTQRFVTHLEFTFQEISKVSFSRLKPILWTGFIVGLIYSGLYLTRTDSYWLLYPFILVVIFQSLRAFIRTRKGISQIKHIAISLFLIAAVTFVGFSLPVGAVMMKNKQNYGVWQVEDYYSGPFAKAFKLWSSVEVPEEPTQSIPISHAKRAMVYGISKTASQLEPFLEGPPVKNMTDWKSFNCANTGICNEAGSWFSYELRDAAVAAASITNEKEFQSFFSQIALDIETNCSSGALKCGMKPIGVGTLPVNEIRIKAVGESAVRAIIAILDFTGADNVSRSETSSSPELNRFWHSVIKFKESPTNGPNSYWTTLGSSISLIKKIYIFLVYFLISLLLLAFVGDPKKFVTREYSPTISILVGSMILFVSGMGIFETTLGFPAGFSLYTLPGQTVFMATILTLVASKMKSVKILSEE